MSEYGTTQADAATAGGVRRQDREQQWRDRVAAWKVSGLKQAAFCREQKLSPADLSWWKHELARRDQALKTEISPVLKPTKARRAFIPVRISADLAGDIEGRFRTTVAWLDLQFSF
jgi:hypothetical protein